MIAPLRVARRITRSGSVGNQHWSLIDQGAVSFGSALTSVLLARNLGQSQFGEVVLLIAAMLFLNTVHASLVVYPLSVEGARLPDVRFHSYFTNVLFGALMLAVPLGLLLAGAAVTVAWKPAGFAVLALIAWQYQETTRRALFARLRHRAAIPGDLLSYVGQATAIGALGVTGELTISRVFIAMAVTSLVGGIVQTLQLRPIANRMNGCLIQTAMMFRSGRWTLPSNLLGAVIMQLPIWALGVLQSSTAAGRLQVLIAIAGVTNPIMFGAANVLTPAVARQRGSSSSARLLATTVSGGAALLLPVLVLVWIWPATILGVLYGRTSSYTNLTTPLRVLMFAYLLVFLAHVGNAALFGLERTHDVLWVQVTGVVVMIAVGLPAAVGWGVMGTVVAVLMAHVVRTVLCGRALERCLRTSILRPIVASEGR